MDEIRKIADKQIPMFHKLKLAWYFDKWYEKLILVGLSAMGVWKLFGLII